MTVMPKVECTIAHGAFTYEQFVQISYYWSQQNMGGGIHHPKGWQRSYLVFPMHKLAAGKLDGNVALFCTRCGARGTN